MKKTKILTSVSVAILLITSGTIHAQQPLSLDECRQMAISSNSGIETANVKMEMADLDRKIARANWFPNISVKGAYMFNEKSPALINKEMSGNMQNAGTIAQDAAMSSVEQLINNVIKNPALAETVFNMIQNKVADSNLAGIVNQIGSEIDAAMHPDLQNVVVGAVSLQQPIFMGGKIVAANKIATLAQELSKTQYEQEYQEILVGVDQSYWQIVSIANKLKLAEAYSELLHDLEKNVQVSIDAGMMTQTDLLEIQVKANEADMLKMKAENGLSLSKMLLCKQIGMELNSDITLVDEDIEEIPLPQMLEHKDIEEIWNDRPEIRSLELAQEIYAKKVNVVRADMMPQIALAANYFVTFPNAFNGFDKKLGGTFNVGVMLNIPIFHGCEQMNKTRKAKAEAKLYDIKLRDAKNMINLQVTQLRKQQEEALNKLNATKKNMDNAEENLRTASVGFEAGVVPTTTAIAAHTAWLQAHSDFIDAGIELQINNVNITKAEATYNIDEIYAHAEQNKKKGNK